MVNICHGFKQKKKYWITSAVSKRFLNKSLSHYDGQF